MKDALEEFKSHFSEQALRERYWEAHEKDPKLSWRDFVYESALREKMTDPVLGTRIADTDLPDDIRGIAYHFEPGDGSFGPESVGSPADRPVAARQQQESRRRANQTFFHIPQVLSGSLPISNTSLPPRMSSSCVRNGRVSGFPSKVADWMYLLSSDTPRAMISKVLPPGR